MDYLNYILGIKVRYLNDPVNPMPNFIFDRYKLQRVLLDDKSAVFVNPKSELDSINSVKKHIDKIEQTEDAPAILVLDKATSRQKEYLLRDHIPFIVEGKQIYLPFMAIYLQERNDSEKPDVSLILPSAQMLLLHFIYNGCAAMPATDAANALGLTPTSISRASKQLTEMGLITAGRIGVQKVISSGKSPEQLFDLAGKHLCSPVKRTIYVPKKAVGKHLLLSGVSALSEYSMLNPPVLKTYAAGSITEWEKIASSSLQNAEEQCAIEHWRYDPRKLSNGNCVDRLSLALALMEDHDERIEDAAEYMLRQVWGDIDGKRN